MTEFISRSYGQEEFEVIIKTDNKEHCKQTEDFARKLIDHAKPQNGTAKKQTGSNSLRRELLPVRLIWRKKEYSGSLEE